MVLEPRARTVDPELLLESLYRLTDLEIRFPLNLNVLDATRTPGVMSLKQALTAWLAFQIEVLLNRSAGRGSARSTTGSSCSTASSSPSSTSTG